MHPHLHKARWPPWTFPPRRAAVPATSPAHWTAPCLDLVLPPSYISVIVIDEAVVVPSTVSSLCHLFFSTSNVSQQPSFLLFCCFAVLLFCCFAVLLLSTQVFRWTSPWYPDAIQWYRHLKRVVIWNSICFYVEIGLWKVLLLALWYLNKFDVINRKDILRLPEQFPIKAFHCKSSQF